MQAYLSEADELFYGGSAGGGKTDLLVGLAITAHKKAIIFRRELRQQRDIIERARGLLNASGARYNGQDLLWRDIPGGRSLEFGAVQYEPDVERYQGRAHDLKAFDELTHFTEYQYRYLIGWNRTTDPTQRCRVVATGNPPLTPEGEWVVQRWGAWLDPQHPNPAEPGELRWYAVIDGEDKELESSAPIVWQGEDITPKSRTFIPARLSDNPYLLETDYGATVQALPEPLRSKLLYGDFGLGFQDDPWQIIPTAWVIAAQERWEQRERPTTPLTALGVDVARGGGDKTLLAKRYDNWFDELGKHPGAETPNGQEVARLVIEALTNEPQATAAVDVIGVGASVYDILTMHNVPVQPVNFSEGTNERDASGRLAFVNKRALYWWRMREALDPDSGMDLALPPDRELRADLTAPRWSMTARGIQVEDKEAVKKRIGRSPDSGDAVVLALPTATLSGKLFY